MTTYRAEPDGSPKWRACARSHLGVYAIRPDLAHQIALGILSGQVKPTHGTDREDIEEREAAVAQVVAAKGVGSTRSSTREISIGLISIEGVMQKGWSKYGGTSTSFVRSALAEMGSDPGIDGVMLFVDSPGGTVVGTDQLAELVREVAAVKPVHAYVDDGAFSAAYYVASQAGHVSTHATGMVGSVGALAVIDDLSRRYKEAGIDVHVIRSWPGKAMIVEGEPVGEEALAKVQKEIDDVGTRFIEQVAAGRGLTKVAGGTEWATGDWWRSEDAQKMGLIDAVMTFDEAMEHLRASIEQGGATVRPTRSSTGSQPGKAGGIVVSWMKTLGARLGMSADATEDEVAEVVAERLGDSPAPAASTGTAENDDPTPAPAGLPEGMVAIKATDLAVLKANSAKVEGLIEREKKRDAAEAVRLGMAEGKIPPAQAEFWTGFVLSNGTEAFTEYLSTAPVIVEMGERGSSVGGEEPSMSLADVEKEIQTKAVARVEAEAKIGNTITVEDAWELVLSEDASLLARMNEAMEASVEDTPQHAR